MGGGGEERRNREEKKTKWMEERKEEKAEIKNLGNITLSEKAGPKTTHYMECPE